jgi:predicted MFS family arabinose efflux permease
MHIGKPYSHRPSALVWAVDVYSYLVWPFSPHTSTEILRLHLALQLREAAWVSNSPSGILSALFDHPTGGVIYPIVFHRLQPRIGFGWTTRVIGFMILATLAVPLTVIKVRVIPAKKRKLVDWVAFTEPAYVLFILGGLVTFMGLYVPFFYIQYFSVSTGVTDSNLGFYLLAILNTASVAGRTIPNFIADKTGPFNMIVPCGFAAGVIIFGLIGTHSVAAIVVISILYGFFSGTFVSLPPACFVLLSPNRGLIGTRMGMGFAIISIGGLIGTPIAGVVLNAHGWVAVWAYAGATASAGSLLMGASRMVRSRGKLIAKV